MVKLDKPTKRWMILLAVCLIVRLAADLIHP